MILAVSILAGSTGVANGQTTAPAAGPAAPAVGPVIPGGVLEAPLGGVALENGYVQTAADGSALYRLASARDALANLALAQDDQERRLAYDTALEALTALYQLHGCTWVLPKLVALYREPGCPDVHTGFSRDGRLYLRVDLMELRNEAFRDYTAYLVTLGSLTPQTLSATDTPGLELRLANGEVLTAELIAPGHPLWSHLDRIADTCRPPQRVDPGRAGAFKQFFAVPKLPAGEILAVSLHWGQYALEVPYYANEVPGG